MLIVEALALIALDAKSGEVRSKLAQVHDQRVLAAGLLMELAVQTRLGLRKKVVVVLDTLPSRHPLLTACLRIIRDASGQLSASQAITLTAAQLPHLRTDLLDGLVRRDILHEPRRTFGLFGRRLYPVRSQQAQGEGLATLRRAASGEGTSLQDLALLSLGCATGAIVQLLLQEEAEAAAARMLLLREEIQAELAESEEQMDEYYSIALLEGLELALNQLLKAR